MKKKNYFNPQDISFMRMALYAAWLGKGKTSPNPSVGAVVVKNNTILSIGQTEPAGGFHAERKALLSLSLNETTGADLYVTLEPCCFYGRTPPCTDIIIEKKIKRVFIAVLDPNPKVQGKGVEILKKAGIEVFVGLLEKQATEINADFFKWIKTGLPFVFFKYAMTLDGKIATLNGDSKWISNTRTLRLAHILRYRADAILVGVQTVLLDNPNLNCRLINRNKKLLRIILDPYGETPLSSQVATDPNPALFVTKRNANREFIEFIKNQSNKELWIDETEGEEINLLALLSFLGKEKQIVSLLVEGGARTLGAFFKQKIGDKIFTVIGNQIIGEGKSPFSGIALNSIKEGAVLDDIYYKKYNNNLLIYGNIRWNNLL